MKKLAGEKAVEYVEDGMIVGLGTGSTVKYSIEKLGKLVKDGLNIIGIPTSLRTKKLATELGIIVESINEHPVIDITIDGADEVDPALNLIKGGGGALTQEKIVAYHSKMEIIVVDESKIVKALGIDFPLPVEITRFGWEATKKSIEEMGCTAERRTIMGEAYITDNQNYIIDCDFDKIDNPEELEQALNNIPGVVENGLFVGLIDEVIVGSKQGIVSHEATRIIQE